MSDELVLNALRKAIERDAEFRLVAIGDGADDAGLFPDRKGPAKKAIQTCTEGDKPFLTVREEAGKGKTPNQFARITDKGITTLAAQTPIKQFPDLIAAAAPLAKTRVIRSCLRSLARRSGDLNPWDYRRLVETCLSATQGQFDAIDARLQEVFKEENILVDSINEFAKTTRTRIENQKQRLTNDLDSLSKAATSLVSPTDAASSGKPQRPQLPEWQRVPNTDPEIDFQRSLGAELVFAWQDTASPDAREGLERALFNVGVERLNAEGDLVVFDSNTHHTEDQVAEGESVEVVLPGWQLVNPRGTSLLARGKVKKASRPSPTKDVVERVPAAGGGEVAAKERSTSLTDGESAKPNAPEPAPSPGTSPEPEKGSSVPPRSVEVSHDGGSEHRFRQ